MEKRNKLVKFVKSKRVATSPPKAPGGVGGVPRELTDGIGAFDPLCQDHLFISYAWENCALADWLVRQLTAHGYRVWCDRFQMLGGEPFPKIIDEAIKTRTFRLIALLSRHSLQKPSPRKERTLALSLGREWGIDFMIPLNVDRLKPSQLPWDYSDLTYIAFEDWGAGLDQLLRALVKAGAPRPITEDAGRRIAAETFLPQHIVERKEEILHTNCFAFERIPERLHAIEWNKDRNRPNPDRFSIVWPFYRISDDRAVSFSLPPAEMPQDCYKQVDMFHWRERVTYEGAHSRDIVSNLLWQSLAYTLLHRGLKREVASGLIYFPRGLMRKNKIKYLGRAGTRTWIAVVGEKSFRGKAYRYNLAPDFQIRQDIGQDFVAQMKIRVRLSDAKGKSLDHASAVARRKHLTGSWFNRQWLNRVLAVASFLARGNSRITLLDQGDPVILFASPLAGEVCFSINEAKLKSMRQELAASPSGWDEDEDAQEQGL
jgi:hypothetical protein